MRGVSGLSPYRDHRIRDLLDAQPFEVFISALCILSGLSYVFVGASPLSIEHALPPLLVHAWGFELVFGAMMTLGGLVFRQARVEQIGLTFLAAAASIYAIVLMSSGGLSSALAASVTLGFSLACQRRARAVRKVIVMLKINADGSVE